MAGSWKQQVSFKNKHCFKGTTEDTQYISVEWLDERMNRKMKLYMGIQHVQRIRIALGQVFNLSVLPISHP